ncbi:Bax inhibitor-1/YccA family protein [Fundidesulfovibrio agrisoli]|uniref:Bax inhibitor-1/YccA family protein n=1 Tax=Fundidesulfovibrio agrisoli TaxID=2922717 RepID=UPI001FAC786B|nr:Bax inhibitor-1/YccA family protein [Fundidesulfovibrio agrisoli]
MYNAANAQQSLSRAEALNAFMRGVYGWMAAGLGLTALIAVMVASSPAVYKIAFNPVVLIVLILAELGLVVGLSARINRMASGTATGMFLAYSALNGVTLSSIFLVYTATSITSAFAVSAGMFLAMSVYGMVTKRDLTSLGSFMFMGLIGIIIASLVNIFLQSSAMAFIINCVGVLVFTGLTAYDTQRLKDMGAAAPMGDATALRRGSILGALTLYLDFINLFLIMLRFFGGNRD